MKWGKKKKGPKSLIEVLPDKKEPVAYPAIDYLTLKPAWRVSLLEMVDPYGWHSIDTADISQIRTRLASFESMTWKEILVQGSYRNHSISVTRLCATAQKRLGEIKQDDVDSLISLGITQKGRVFGILDYNVLRVLWWDPDHLVCPIQKPNT